MPNVASGSHVCLGYMQPKFKTSLETPNNPFIYVPLLFPFYREGVSERLGNMFKII